MPPAIEPTRGPWSDPRTAADARAYLRYTTLAALTGLAATLAAVVALPHWLGATVAVGQGMLWCGALLRRHPSRWLFNIVVAGVVAGVVELLADAWLVDVTGTLVYPQSGPQLWRSPAYMPLAWFGMLSCGCALGVALRRRWSVAFSSVAVALVVGLYIPLYEALAAHADWWHYRDCALLFAGVPIYIALGEVLIALPLVLVTERLIRASTLTAAALGVGLGLWIFVSYVIAWHAVLGWNGGTA